MPAALRSGLWRTFSFSLLLLLAGCQGVPTVRPHAPETWTAGFWFWQGSSGGVQASGPPIDVLFCQVGRITRSTYPAVHWDAYAELPTELPPARSYWLVFRFDERGIPSPSVAATLADQVSKALAAAEDREVPVAGIQLDIDSPTGQLSEYAKFLREVRRKLPPGVQLSITALLDWFRPGTAIRDVLAQVDEYVPQFYDLGNALGVTSRSEENPIASPIDSAKWAPVFEKLEKRFRIGISTFGRTRLVPNGGPAASGSYLIGDLKPLDVGTDPAFSLTVSRTSAQEVQLNYRANRDTRLGYSRLSEGDTIQFVLATPDSIRESVSAAKRFGSYCAGVLFFRWPSERETLAAPPDEVLSSAGLRPAQATGARLFVSDGSCAAVYCVDLYLRMNSPLSPDAQRYAIRSSSELEYFLPYERVPIRLAGSALLALQLPPYGGRTQLYLGRAVTKAHAEYRLQEER